VASQREKKVQLREDEILTAASRLIEQVGFAGLTMDMVAEATAIAKATLYTHFKSKEALASAIVVRVFQNMLIFIQTLQGSGAAQLEAIIGYMLRSQDTVKGFSAVAMRDDLASILLNDPTAQTNFATANGHISRIIELGKADGSIHPHLLNEAIQTMLFSTRALLMVKQMYPDQAAHDRVIEHGIQIFLRGIRP